MITKNTKYLLDGRLQNITRCIGALEDAINEFRDECLRHSDESDDTGNVEGARALYEMSEEAVNLAESAWAQDLEDAVSQWEAELADLLRYTREEAASYFEHENECSTGDSAVMMVRDGDSWLDQISGEMLPAWPSEEDAKPDAKAMGADLAGTVSPTWKPEETQAFMESASIELAREHGVSADDVFEGAVEAARLATVRWIEEGAREDGCAWARAMWVNDIGAARRGTLFEVSAGRPVLTGWGRALLADSHD